MTDRRSPNAESEYSGDGGSWSKTFGLPVNQESESEKSIEDTEVSEDSWRGALGMPARPDESAEKSQQQWSEVFL